MEAYLSPAFASKNRLDNSCMRYLTGLIVLPTRKNVLSISRSFVDSKDQSSVNNFITDSGWESTRCERYRVSEGTLQWYLSLTTSCCSLALALAASWTTEGQPPYYRLKMQAGCRRAGSSFPHLVCDEDGASAEGYRQRDDPCHADRADVKVKGPRGIGAICQSSTDPFFAFFNTSASSFGGILQHCYVLLLTTVMVDIRGSANGTGLPRLCHAKTLTL